MAVHHETTKKMNKPYYFGFWVYALYNWELRLEKLSQVEIFPTINVCLNERLKFTGITITPEFVIILKLKFEDIEIIDHDSFFQVRFNNSANGDDNIQCNSILDDIICNSNEIL